MTVRDLLSKSRREPAGDSQMQGRVKDLREISPKTGDYTCGIGHTRWATMAACLIQMRIHIVWEK